MIIGGRHKFDENLADDADTGVFHIGNRNIVEIVNDLAAHVLKLTVGNVLCRDQFFTARLPFAVQRIDGTGRGLVGAHPVDAAHEQIAERDGIDCTHQHFCIDLKSRIALQF